MIYLLLYLIIGLIVCHFTIPRLLEKDDDRDGVPVVAYVVYVIAWYAPLLLFLFHKLESIRIYKRK
jgi:hypothetical protein